MDEETIIETGRGLVTDEGADSEYERAVVEFATQLLGRPMSDARLVALALGVKNVSRYDY